MLVSTSKHRNRRKCSLSNRTIHMMVLTKVHLTFAPPFVVVIVAIRMLLQLTRHWTAQ